MKLPGAVTSARAFAIFTAVALMLSLAVTLPGIGGGLVVDDDMHAAYVAVQNATGSHRFWDMFNVCGRPGPSEIAERIDSGLLPWWSAPNLRLALFRPLASATHYLDYSLWPGRPVVMHVENCLAYVLLVASVAMLYRRIGGRSYSPILATLLYAVSEAHAGATSWIAGRNTLMTAAFVAACLVAHDRARRDGGARSVAPLALVLAQASSEGAVAAWAYLVPYAIFLDRGPVRERVRALLPSFAVTATWQILYRVEGYGVRGSGAYRDPFTAPYAFVTDRVPHVLPAALREILLPAGAPAALVGQVGTAPAIWAFGAVLLCVALLFLRAREDRRVAFWLCALPVSILPMCAVEFTPRLLFIPDIAGYALVADLLVALHRAAIARGRLAMRVPAAALGLFLLYLHGMRAPVRARHAHEVLPWLRGVIVLAAQSLPPFAASHYDEVFVLNTPNYFVTALSPAYAWPGTWPAHLFVLGSSLSVVHLERPDSTSFVLEVDEGYVRDPYSQIVRAPELSFSPGQTIAMGPMQVTVEATTRDGHPRRVRFRTRELEKPRALWVTWSAGRYQPVQLPAIGERISLPPI